MANTMNVLPRRISPKWLEDKGACGDQVKLFAGEWPDGCDVTEANLRRAGEIGMLLEWLADRALPRSLYADYQAKRAPLDADYRAKFAPLVANYQAKREALYADYQAKRALLDADYEAKRAPLYADYQAKRAPLDADYQAKRDALLIGFLWPYYESHVAVPETLPEFESVADTQKAGATN